MLDMLLAMHKDAVRTERVRNLKKYRGKNNVKLRKARRRRR